MPTKKEIGNIGEEHAVKYLLDKGYSIEQRNWRFSRAEIDIIAKYKEALIFIEVKTRSYTYYGQPEEAVKPWQEALIIDAANAYMRMVDHDWEIRFDIISIVLKEEGNFELKHFEDAFF
jgi:putative endonuclease